MADPQPRTVDPTLAADLLAVVIDAPDDRQHEVLIQAAHVYDVLTDPNHEWRTCRRCRTGGTR
jgi:hypothetical protein